MQLEDALRLFNRLGIQVPELTPLEFKAAYYQLAWRYHSEQSSGHGQELMANINAARSTILKSYRWRTTERGSEGDARTSRTGDRAASSR
jgi:hypothetical protein